MRARSLLPGSIPIALAVVCSAFTARAAPVAISHAGFLVDAGDVPLEVSALPVRFRIFGASSAGSPVWDSGAGCTVAVRSGYYSVVLGDGCGVGLDSAQFPPGTSRWLEVTVDATPLEPRLHLAQPPVAAFARVAEEVAWSGGTVALGANGKWPASTLDVPAGLVSTDAGGKIPVNVLPTTVALLDANTLRLPEIALPASVPLLGPDGKLPLSTLPSGPAGLDAASVGGHTPEDATGGDQRLALRDTLGLLDADTVGGYGVSATPAANKLLPLDSNGKIPASVISGSVASSFTTLTLGSLTLDEATLGALLTPLQLSPDDGAATGTLTPTFRWTGAGPFLVEVVAASAPSVVVWSTTTAGSSATSGVTLAAGTTYQWRVHAQASGNDVASGWRSFTTLGATSLSGTTVADSTRTTLTATVVPGATALALAANVFRVGDVLLVINLQGGAAGLHEFVTVAGLSASGVTLAAPVRNGYPSSDKVVVQRAIYGAGVTVSGTVTASTWNGTAGGVVAIYSFGDVTMLAGSTVTADALGYAGGAWRATCSGAGNYTPDGAGESYRGTAGYQNTPNDGGGGGAMDGCATCTSGGAGGSHSTVGVSGTADQANNPVCWGGRAGHTYGDSTVDTANLGSGGGAGSNSNGNGGAGGRGGGIIVVHATGTINTSQGTLTARGGTSNTTFTHKGGGGAGGSIVLKGNTVVTGVTDVAGGAGGGTAGAGGSGRVKIFQGNPTTHTITGTIAADSVKTRLTTNVLAGATTLDLAAALFRPGDVLLVIDMQGEAAGLYEFVKVASLTAGGGVNLVAPLRNGYPGAVDKVTVQRAISATNIQVNGIITATAWNGQAGGVAAIYADNDVTFGAGSGANLDALGYVGGVWRQSCSGVGNFTPDGAGESYRFPGSFQNANNDGAAGGAMDGCATCTSGGSGGSHATLGQSGSPDSQKGQCMPGIVGHTYGDGGLETVFLGSGGGAGSNSSGNGGSGGRGGGALIVHAGNAINASLANFTARGTPCDLAYPHRGGGGAGGSIVLDAPSVSPGSTDVSGGAGGGTAGAGGSGHVKNGNLAATERVLTGNVTTDTIRTVLTASVARGATFLPLPRPPYRVGDVLLLMDVQGVTAGLYEFVRVASVSATGVTLTQGLQRAYTTADRLTVQKTISGAALRVKGTLTATRWNGSAGGISAIWSDGDIVFEAGSGANVDALGFGGGVWRSTCSGAGGNTPDGAGESWLGVASYQWFGNGGGAGGSMDGCATCTSGGTGGSLATYGTWGTSDTPSSSACLPGLVGSLGGDGVDTVLLGSGGGAGSNSEGNGGAGGRGGGALIVHAVGNVTATAATFNARGGVSNTTNTHRGGGGSGGSILVRGNSVAMGTSNVTGGAGGGTAAAGGSGHVHVVNDGTTGAKIVSGTTIADMVRTTPTASLAIGDTFVPLTRQVFLPGDVVLVYDAQGTNAGRYEFVTISSVGATGVTLGSALTKAYPSSDRIVVQRAISGNGIQVSGTVSATQWDGTGGGVVAMYSTGNLTFAAGTAVNVDGAGYRGGTWRQSCSGVGGNTPDGAGESWSGPGPFQNTSYNGGGGGAEDGCAACTSGGGGGGYGSAGSTGLSDTPGNGNCDPGQGGTTYGDTTRNSLLLGAGGGAGSNAGGNGGYGGRGGGAIILYATGTVNFAGSTLSARGAQNFSTAVHRGGSGAGGTILVVAPTITSGTTVVTGGAIASNGGAGGGGRAKLFTEAP